MNNLAAIDGSSEYTLVRQLWDSTVETLSFWWVDDKHVLDMTNREFRLWRKTGNIDPWDGDEMRIVLRVDKRLVLESESDTFLVSSAYKDLPFIVMMSAVDSEDLKLKVRTIDPYGSADPEAPDFCFRQLYDYKIRIVKKDLGEKLVSGNGAPQGGCVRLFSYTYFDSYTLLAAAKLSATAIAGEQKLLGIALDKNLCQWVVDLTTMRAVVGYGHVGLKGELTGGQVPTNFWSWSGGGFTGTVRPISALGSDFPKSNADSYNVHSVAELANFPGAIYGTNKKQYYIYKSIGQFVSHVKYDLGTKQFLVVSVDMSNNYAEKYVSPSRQLCRLDGKRGQNIRLADLWPQDSGVSRAMLTTINLASFGAAFVVYQHFLFTNILYMQQTLGQYAYVWSGDDYEPKRPILDDAAQRDPGLTEDSPATDATLMMKDDFLFDIKRVKQEHRQGEADFNEVWLRTFFIVADSLLAATGFSAPNTTQAIMHTGEVASAFGAGFLQSLATQVPAELSNQASTIWLSGTTYVTATKRLDMFYSTGDHSHFSAGRGFVNHNFVAQCLAQSSTAVSLQGYVLSNSVINAEVFKLTTKIGLALQEALYEFLESEARDFGGNSGFIGFMAGVASGAFTSVLSSVLSLAFTVAAKLVEYNIKLTRYSLETLDNMLATTGIYPNSKTYVSKQVSKYNYDIEGLHRYGDKSISFFWPAYGVTDRVRYTDELVEAGADNVPWSLDFTNDQPGKRVFSDKALEFTTAEAKYYDFMRDSSSIPYWEAMLRGRSVERMAPQDMAVIEGTTGFLPTNFYKNENINCSRPVFPAVLTHDYEIDRDWNLGVAAANDGVLWVFCKDTKVLDGDYTNIVDNGWFCGVASTYAAIEVKSRVQQKYLRPQQVTPQALSFNVTGLNCVYDGKMYHAFDGESYRYVEWHGGSGVNKELLWRHYIFQRNDRFKRSNILPPNLFMGNFDSRPVVHSDSDDPIENVMTCYAVNEGTENDIPGENKDLRRYSVPIFTEPVSTLPAMVKTLSSYQLDVVDGLTSLTTGIRNTQTEYKAPKSVDFNIGDTLYRVTNEYICQLQNEQGVVVMRKLVPTLGLTYIGSTLQQAFFYSQATRCYYTYSGGTDIKKVDMIERFRNVLAGRWDFVNQQLVLDTLATMDRVDRYVRDYDSEIDNNIVPMLDNSGFSGEVTPPNENIMDHRSWYKMYSLPSGFAYQGPNRCQVNRFIYNAYMLDDVKANYGRWKKVPREDYHPFREYPFKFKDISEFPTLSRGDVVGWTHNPFLLVTSPLGVSPEVDAVYEWEVNFAFTKEMEELYRDDMYVCVNLMAETFCPGGKVYSRPTHVYLHKKLFTESSNVGYYTFRYSSQNGAGNRERLHIWCDGIIAVAGLKVSWSEITQKRTDKLVIQEDVAKLVEM